VSQPPADLPREPYRALAVFLILPLVAAAFGAQRGSLDTRPSATAVVDPSGRSGGSHIGAPLGSALGPSVAAARGRVTPTAPRQNAPTAEARPR